jgi:hypothetical protein
VKREVTKVSLAQELRPHAVSEVVGIYRLAYLVDERPGRRLTSTVFQCLSFPFKMKTFQGLSELTTSIYPSSTAW